MIKKNNFAIFIMTAIILTVAIAVMGCTSPTQQDNDELNNESTIVPSAQATDTNNIPQTSGASDSGGTAESQANHVEGKYVGQIDNNSIEVIVDDESGAYRLTDTTKLQVSALTEGQTIGFTYEVNDQGQNVITSFDDTEQMMTAEFVGLADSHTIEVIKDGSAIAFQLTGDALTQVNSISEGDNITIVYIMNESGQKVATSITVN